ncbi:MAG TPA: hypothetical protein VLI39_05640, partial [Sedimentisphaerales bacterium]|nr:hypothetical protein [Sedimentisphaerales bacterium]
MRVSCAKSFDADDTGIPGKCKVWAGNPSRLRCVEVAEIQRVGTDAGNDFPADRADFDRDFHGTEDIFGFFDPKG